MPDFSPPPRLEERHALFLDFDGTLAPIQDDPDKVVLSPENARALAGLESLIGEAIAIISGRDVRDLSARVPNAYWRAGGHGLEICGPGEGPPETAIAAPRGLVNAIEMITSGLEGVRMERKGPVIAVHFRQAPEMGEMLLARLKDTVRDDPDYKIQAGKMVLEAKPAHAHKGRAITHMMEHAPFRDRLPVMVGDDTTDEDAFDAVNRLGGFSIKVGPGETAAQYRLEDTHDVTTWLTEQGR
ncbi:trehalose-phosphatase [Henriciella aquimarina]|uniref:trehalose-phosphatase n=1 Tax=Henriciella aquimarina TaxID=545261 RepID=UPI000A037BF2|nr:trehalose-phosphatase [Henriciella aquimarina]